jgi:hypothetical protein
MTRHALALAPVLAAIGGVAGDRVNGEAPQ